MLRNKQNSLKNWRRLKKILNEEIDYLLFEDESMIRDYQAIQKTWFAKGNQRIIQTYGKHEGVKLVGFLNYETGEVYVEEHKTYNAEVFKIFLQNVLKKYPQGKIVMILDNAKIHHAKLLKEFLEKNNIHFYTDIRRFDDLPFKVETFAFAKSVVYVTFVHFRYKGKQRKK